MLSQKPSPLIFELHRIRVEQHLSRRKLAIAMGITAWEGDIFNWEVGISSPNFRYIEPWVAALGYELDLHKLEEPADVKI